ncbi:MAG: type I secretion system permease/ATPase [Hyphomicrobiaceae bacterium]
MPASSAPGPPRPRPNWSDFTLALKAGRNALLGIGLFSAFLNILALTGALFMLQIYDRVLPSGSVPTLVALSLLAAILFAFYGLLDFVRGRVLVRLGAWFDAAISPKVYRAIVRLPMSRIPDSSKIEPLRDLDAVRSFLSGPAPAALFDLPWVPLYLGVIYLFHPLLALLALAGMLVLFCVMLATELLTRSATAAVNACATARQRLSETSRRNAEALTALGMVSHFALRWDAANDLYMASQQRVSDLAGGLGSLARALRMLLQSAVLGWGAYLVICQEASAGLIIAASILTGRALAPLDLAIPNWRSWTAARQAWKRLAKLLQVLPDPASVMPLKSPHQQLAVERVSAMPPGSTRLVIKDACFTVQKGQALGIIGASASGKSSLARLLVGAWTPAAGKVRLDGAALDQWSPQALGRHIGYLPQTVELLPGTVAENIARFQPDADPEDISRAADAAGVHELIVNLPEGYQTAIGEQGAGLSAGQQQRIALARALYDDPFLVVLDEPNSNLDAEGEAALTQAIIGVRDRGGIAVVIAHHPSALASVDTVLVLGQGRIKDFGPKDRILSRVLRPAATHPPLKVVTEATGVVP